MSNNLARSLRRPRLRRGATTVELAIAAPVLLILVFGIMQVAYAFSVQHAIQSAAYKGCRAGTLPTRSNAAVTSAVKTMLQPNSLDGISTVSIQVNSTSGSVSNAVAGDDVSVVVTVPVSKVTLFPGFFSGWNGTLTGAVTLRCQ